MRVEGSLSDIQIDVKNRVPPERTRLPGGGIELPFIHFCMGQRFIKGMYEKKFNNIKKDLIF